MKPFAQRLKQFRKARGLTQKEVAKQLGIPATTYRDWEYGKSIQGEPYVELAEILNVSVVHLMTGTSSAHRDLVNAITELEELVRNIKKIVVSI